MKKAETYLREMLIELADIAEYTKDGREVFMLNRMAQKAVIRSYEVIGEIVKRVPQEIREANPQIDWSQLAGFRDFLAHHYDVVIIENVWIAVEDLPNLRAAVEALLHNLSANDAT